MLSSKSNKELVEAGHQFAKALDADMPLTDIAKLVSVLASRLDCAIVRGNELQQKLDAMAEESAELKSAANALIKTSEECEINGDEIKHVVGTDEFENLFDCVDKTPATNAYLNSVRAEGVEKLLNKYAPYTIASSEASEFAARLRSGTHDTANKAEGIEPASLTALPVERDQYGYWSHPDYLAFCDGREYIPSAEFNQWMESKGMEWTVDYRDEEEIEPGVDGYDLSAWNPQAPAGDGWFVGSIHDTEDGAVCIWLRAKAGV